MLGEVKQIHKSDYGAACSLALSLSMQQPHCHLNVLKSRDYWILTNTSPQHHVPSPYSSKHFKEDTLPFSVHDVPRYLSGAFQPLFPRQRIRGFKVLDQLHNTSKSFPTLRSPLQVSRSFHPQRELLCWPQCKTRAILGRLPGLHS